MYRFTRIVTSGLILSMTIFFVCQSCVKEKTNYDNNPTSIGISGKWEFTLAPLDVWLDTTLIKGFRASDFPVYNGTFNNVYLYEDASGDIIGETVGYKFKGKRTGSDLTLNIYDHPDGPYNTTVPIDSMALFSTMNLQLDDYGFLKGNGYYHDYPTYPNIVKNTYLASARKVNDLTLPLKEENDLGEYWCHYFKVPSPYTEMNSCYKQKDGGGYYIYGQDGGFPATATLYIPYEWELCKTREYSFTVSIKRHFMDTQSIYDQVMPLAKKNAELNTLFGDPLLDPDNFNQLLFDFYVQFGEFAYTIAYDSHTKHYSLYINHSKGSGDAVINHWLTKNITQNNPYFYSIHTGSTIKDKWNLKRVMDGLSCTCYMQFSYLFGTALIHYN
jgi:hypothetical protein